MPARTNTTGTFAVGVWSPGPHCPDRVAALLGVPSLPLDDDDRLPAPAVHVNGVLHLPTTLYLARLALRGAPAATLRRHAQNLRLWLWFLLNLRRLMPLGDHRDALFAAVEKDFAAFHRRLQHGDAAQRVSGDSWDSLRATLKAFYLDHWGRFALPMPFEVRMVSTPYGRVSTIVGYRAVRRRRGSKGLPLTPEFCDLLVQGCLRVRGTGEQDSYAAAERDAAVVETCLAFGPRRLTLVSLTHYELPRPAGVEFTVANVPSLVTKNGAGGQAFAFTHRLHGVWGYVQGARADAAKRRPHRPPRPLHLVAAGQRRVRYTDPERPGLVVDKAWDDCDRDERLRMVEPGGTSPLLFLNSSTGRPLAYSSMQHAVSGAASFVRAHLDDGFPDGFRLHDLRHTYAVHLVVSIFNGRLAQSLPASSGPDYVVDTVGSALDMAMGSLGHASEASTKLYTSTAHRFLSIPAGEFVGAGR